MQKTIRINESQLLYLSSKARLENTLSGTLWKRSADTGKWQQRWFALYQNLLFYYENESGPRPSGVALLEGCYCERIVAPSVTTGKGRDTEKQYCLAVYYRKEGQRQFELRSESESEITIWIEAIQQASFSKIHEQKEQLEQKHLHLLQILDTERQSKWHYVQQTEELNNEVRKLKNEVRKLKNEIRSIRRDRFWVTDIVCDSTDSDEIRKIKKVQSFFRGWLCRRRWKQIVELYIRSDHAESMRKRNSIVFSLVECEEDYVKQLSALVSVFLRPLRMAASSKIPPITHDDVNSIFLNSETLLFLHQIFLKGLLARMENWPTIVLDLFDMLLPMLGIYQEYVRNHHYSLQVLAEYKQKTDFNQLLKRYEEKSVCEGRSLANFLTYPMHQVPRYIITIHQLLAHTPHDHVERKSLEFALSKLEEISQIMQDEVSETENIRKNLSIERMIIEGCDILLDVNQTFVRQGTLIQVTSDKCRTGLGRLGSFSSTFKDARKETVRMAFLFTNHLLLTSRASNGRLHLAKNCGKIPLSECTLIEDPGSEIAYNFDDDTSSYDSSLSLASQNSWSTGGQQSSSSNLLPTPSDTASQQQRDQYNGLDFRIMMESRCGGGGSVSTGPPVTITLVASTLQEKAAWCSDISQCIENLQCSDLLNGPLSETSSVAMPQSVRTDPKLFRDDVDIKFSRSLNSCKVPQIRHASVDRLLDRLTDLRFLSIDFLNTFLLTYRVFTTGRTVMDALKRVYRNPEYGFMDSSILVGGIQVTGCAYPQLTSRHSFDGDDVTVAMTTVPLTPPLAPPCAPLAPHNDELQHQQPVQLLLQHQQQPSSTSSSSSSSTGGSGIVCDSKHLMKPVTERLRRLSTGSMRIEVTGGGGSGTGASSSSAGVGPRTIAMPTVNDCYAGVGSGFGAGSSSATSGFRKYERSGDFTSVMTSTELNQPSSAGVIIGCPPGGLLSLPKPKLAPIASCETLSESFDLQATDGTLLVAGGGGTSSGESSLGSSPVGSLSDDSNSGSWYQTPTGGAGGGSATASTPGHSSLVGNAAAITITTSSDSAFSSLHRRSATSSPRTSIDDQPGSSGGSTSGTVGMTVGGRCGGCGTILTVGCVGSSGGNHGAVGGGSASFLAPSGSESGLSTTTSCDALVAGYRAISAAASSDTLVPGSPSIGSSLSGSPTTAASTNSVASTTAVNLSSSNTQLQQSNPSQATAQQQQQQSSSLKRQLAALLLVNFRGGNGGSSGRKSRASGGSSTAAAAASTNSISASSAASLQSSHQLNALALSPATSPKFGQGPLLSRRHGAHHQVTVGHSGGSVSPWELSPDGACLGCGSVVNIGVGPSTSTSGPTARRATSPSPLRRSPINSPKLCRAPSPISYSYSSPNIITNLVKPRPFKPGSTESDLNAFSFSPRSSCCTAIMESGSSTVKAGTVVTSSRASRRRSSSTAAAAAFAAATAGSCTPKTGRSHLGSVGGGEMKLHPGISKKRESAISTAATMRVLNILRHWVSKHSQDFDTDPELKAGVKDLLEEMVSNSCLLPAEHKAASSILHVLIKDDEVALKTKVNLELLLAPPETPSKDSFDTLSALDIAEQMTYLDHQIFMAINSDELLGQAWMKPDKSVRAPHVLLVSKRFNEASCLVVSEIVRRQNLQERASCIEKWAAIADICRCMHNYNGVLQICAAFVNSAIYRLRKTWEKIPKQTKQMVERLQVLVSSDGRFKNMRDALHRCDPPCIPYLGMYLTDLSFIEEGTSNTTDEGLINFSKMRMITHVIKEIQLFQQTPYKIEHHRRVTNYLLDPSRLLGEEQTFRSSLEMEPRNTRISSVSGQSS